MVDENKVRKQWLHSFFLSLAVSVIGETIEVVLALCYPEFAKKSLLQHSLIYSICVSLCSLLITSWTTYYCAYQKRGTFLLYGIIVFNLLFFAYMLFALLTLLPIVFACLLAKKDYLGSHIGTVRLIFGFLIQLPVNYYYWINCYRLYEVNKAYKASEEQNGSPLENVESAAVETKPELDEREDVSSQKSEPISLRAVFFLLFLAFIALMFLGICSYFACYKFSKLC